MKRLSIIAGTASFLFLLGSVALGSYAAEKGDPETGKKIYGFLCAPCHGTSGKGDGQTASALPVKPRNHTDGKYMNALTDKYLFDLVKGGGVSAGKSPLMPPWGNRLNDKDIRNVLSYIRSLAVPPYKETHMAP